ncbi:MULTISPECIES: immunity 8 family protein [unclassified Burkholderia]|uniref:immunity 8 family protein n=1 Tax=unclassified Burkholderia TaxID=2613784 RepID=UPI001588F782|nr:MULTISPECIES: immunity 8 family protein [unclassified Burkholderia]
MKAEIKSLYSLQLEDTLINYLPDDVSNFGTWIRAYIGPQGEEGSEAFDIEVCTPEWLKSRCTIEGAMWGRHMLIVGAYDYEAIKAFIERYVATCHGDDWAAIATKLSRMGAWEFEDYRNR